MRTYGPFSQVRRRNKKMFKALGIVKGSRESAIRGRVAGGSSDKEFLPAALSIIETPPSPIRIALIYTIAALTAAVIAWSYFGYLDVHAVASGKVQPSGRAKVVQPVETGRVVTSRVKNGDQVKAGDVLIELDRTEAFATRTATIDNLASVRAEIARRQIAIGAVDSIEAAPGTLSLGPRISRRRSVLEEDRVLAADIGQLTASIDSLKAQKVQKEAERNKAIESIKVEKQLVDVMVERVGMYEKLFRQKFGSRLEVDNALHDLLEAKAQLVEFEGAMREAVAALSVIEADILKTKKTFVSDNAQKLAEAEQKAVSLFQDLAKADLKLEHMTLTAPVAGTIQASTVTTLGQIVDAGQELMHIVPEGTPLEIEAYVLNRDAGFVAVGQEAVVKVDAFPYTRYGTIVGKVARLAEDAIPGAEAQQNLRDPSQAPSGTLALTSAAQQTQDLVYPVTIIPSDAAVVIDGKSMPISSGMTVTVEIKTEQRRVIDYILSPLIDVGTTAMRER